jgi:hypothetical protein
MATNDLDLPRDLTEFLASGGSLEYDAALCEAGQVRLHGLSELRLRTFDANGSGTNDRVRVTPLPGVDLIGACTGDYDPEGLLVWFPGERSFGAWDASHDEVFLFGVDVAWTEIARSPARFINAQWDFDDLERAEVVRWTPSTKRS